MSFDLIFNILEVYSAHQLKFSSLRHTFRVFEGIIRKYGVTKR